MDAAPKLKDIKKDLKGTWEEVKKEVGPTLEKVKGQATAKAAKGISILRKVPKPIYYGLGGLIIYHWGIKPLFKDAGKLLDTDPGNDKFKDTAGQVYKRPTGDGSNLGTLSDHEIQSIADRQLSLMDRPGTGNNLFADLQGLSGKDLQRVYIAFGKVWYDPILGVQSGSAFSLIGHKELDLFQWYEGELDESEMQQMRAIWQKSGIAFPQSNTALS